MRRAGSALLRGVARRSPLPGPLRAGATRALASVGPKATMATKAPSPAAQSASSASATSEASLYGHCHSQPKIETGVCEFLEKNPGLDGRGVLVAIMDTGVDPAADGLQKTSEGKRKVIDAYDCTGAGDVDTSHVATAKDGVLTGLSGRSLKLPDAWPKAPSGKYHLGLLPVYQLYPKSVRERVSKVRKERLWETTQREVLVAAERELNAHEDSLGKEDDKLDKLADRLQREELRERVALLKEADKGFEDTGPVADVLVFHDGQDWKAAIDTSYAGRLVKTELLGAFREKGEFGKLCQDDLLTYSVNIHKNGSLLEIVVPGSHGTHVAAMTAGCYPEEPEKDGIAPGAQLVSLRIGDQRLGGGMEVGGALTRALDKCVQLGVDVINFSFGEAADVVDVGRVVEALEDTVWKRGILFVSSAGNNGPALSTGGAPGSTSSACFGIGAWLSPEMMTGLYSLREKGLPNQLFPWSSRGPTADGALGTSVCAPGGAITSVPKWTLQGAQLMNGTSMSSPHVTGCVALLMSGLKARDLPSSPFIVRTALENTAAPPTSTTDVFSCGRGLINVPQAWEWLEQNSSWLSPGLTRLKVKVNETQRGVYLREPGQVDRPRDFLVTMRPVFREDFDNEAKRAWSKSLQLRAVDEEGAPADYVVAPETLQLGHETRAFTITVDPTMLSKGSLNFAQLEARDSGNPEAGPLALVPITVVKPLWVEPTPSGRVKAEWEELSLAPGETATQRFFVAVPAGADYAVVRLESLDAAKVSRYVLHALQLLPDMAYRSTEHHKYISLSELGTEETAFKVVGGRTLELCLAKWWTSLGESRLSMSLEFHAAHPARQSVETLQARSVHKFHVEVPLGEEELLPVGTLKWHHQPLRPTEALVRPLGERDRFQEERQIYELRLTYALKAEKAGTELAVSTGATDGLLYESPLDAQLWQLFDANKRYVGAGDAFPGRNLVKVSKGDHTLILQYRHDSEIVLDKLKDQILTLRWKMDKPLPVDFYSSFNDAFAGSGKIAKAFKLYGKSRKALYAALPTDDKLPKAAGPGHFLSGSLSLANEAHGKRVSLFPLTLHLQASPTPAKKNGGKKADKKADLGEQIRDVKLAHVCKASVGEGAAISAALIRDFPDHLPVYQTRLKKLAEKSLPEHRGEILWLSQEIQARVDMKELLVFAGTKTDVNLGDKASTVKAEMEKKKVALVEALAAKGVVLADLYMEKEKAEVAALFKDPAIPTVPATPSSAKLSSSDEGTAKTEEEEETQKEASPESPSKAASEGPPRAELPASVGLAEVEAVWAELGKLCEAGDAKAVVFTGKAAAARGHFARALRLFGKANEERPAKYLDGLVLRLVDRLAWTHLANYHKHNALLKHPPVYRPF